MRISDYIEFSEPVDWRQGMLLSPQHFQQQELHIDSLATQKLYISQPHYWGLIEMDVNHGELQQGRISISRLYAVFPDGEVVDYSTEKGESPLTAEVRPEDLQELEPGEPISISVAIVRRGLSGTGSQQRYEAFDCVGVCDENNLDQKVDLKKKKLALRIFASNRVPSRYISLPLFKLNRTDKNSFELHDYHPPMLDASVSQSILGEESLWSGLQELAELMRSKARSLAATQSSNFSDRTTINALMGRLPRLEVLLSTPRTHPYELYLAFVDVVSSLFSMEYFQEFFQPRGYDHENPAPAFLEYLHRLAQQIQGIELAFESRPFIEMEEGEFQIDLPASLDLDDIAVAVVPRDGQDPRVAVSWINSALVGSLDALPKLRLQRVLGAGRRPMPGQERIEKRLPVRGNIVVFSNEAYDLDGASYAAILPGQKLFIRGKAGTAPAAIHLYIQQRNGAGKATGDGT